jgi:hypothetical protein
MLVRRAARHGGRHGLVEQALKNPGIEQPGFNATA